jgi:hypothetical protein
MQEQANQTDPDAPQLVASGVAVTGNGVASEFHRPAAEPAPLFRDARVRTIGGSRTGPGGVPLATARPGGMVAKAPAPGRSTAHVPLWPFRIASIGAGRERRSGQRGARHLRARKAPERARQLWYGGRQREPADSRTLTEPWPLSARRPAQVGQTQSRLSPTCARVAV